MLNAYIAATNSVHLFVQCKRCVQRMQNISSHFLAYASTGIILFFETRKPLTNSEGAVRRDAKHTRLVTFRFSTEIAIYLENNARQTRGYYGSLIGSRIADQSASVPIERRHARDQIFFPANLRNNNNNNRISIAPYSRNFRGAHAIWPRTKKFVKVNTCDGGGVFLWISHTDTSRGGGRQQVPKIYCNPADQRPHGLTQNDPIHHGNTYGGQACFYEFSVHDCYLKGWVPNPQRLWDPLFTTIIYII